MALQDRITTLAQAVGADIKALWAALSSKENSGAVASHEAAADPHPQYAKADAHQAIAATTYDAAGLLTSVTYGSGSKALYAYNGDNQLVTAQHTGTDGTTVIVTVTYTYNADGTLAAATRS